MDYIRLSKPESVRHLEFSFDLKSRASLYPAVEKVICYEALILNYETLSVLMHRQTLTELHLFCGPAFALAYRPSHGQTRNMSDLFERIRDNQKNQTVAGSRKKIYLQGILVESLSDAPQCSPFLVQVHYRHRESLADRFPSVASVYLSSAFLLALEPQLRRELDTFVLAKYPFIRAVSVSTPMDNDDLLLRFLGSFHLTALHFEYPGLEPAFYRRLADLPGLQSCLNKFAIFEEQTHDFTDLRFLRDFWRLHSISSNLRFTLELIVSLVSGLRCPARLKFVFHSFIVFKYKLLNGPVRYDLMASGNRRFSGHPDKYQSISYDDLVKHLRVLL